MEIKSGDKQIDVTDILYVESDRWSVRMSEKICKAKFIWKSTISLSPTQKYNELLPVESLNKKISL